MPVTITGKLTDSMTILETQKQRKSLWRCTQMAISYNKAILVGRLTRDVETQFANNGTAIIKNNIAVQRQFKGKNATDYETDFINVVAFGKTAEFIGNYFAKGNLIMIEGRIQTGKYENKDGVTVYTTDVVAEKVNFIETKKQKEQRRGDDVTYNEPEEEV